MTQQPKLKGTGGTPTRRVAIINDKTFAAGEDLLLGVGGQNTIVRCLKIREPSILVAIAGIKGIHEITLTNR